MADQRVMAAASSVTDKADVVRYGHGHVKGGQQNQPVPHSLEDAVVQQDETGLPHRSHLVVGHGRFLKDALKDRTKFVDILMLQAGVQQQEVLVVHNKHSYSDILAVDLCAYSSAQLYLHSTAETKCWTA